MSDHVRFLTYCGLTCMGGSEAKQCPCEHPHDCEMRDHSQFDEYQIKARQRMFRVAVAKAGIKLEELP